MVESNQRECTTVEEQDVKPSRRSIGQTNDGTVVGPENRPDADGRLSRHDAERGQPNRR